MQENEKITPEEERAMKWILVFVALIIIMALTSDSVYNFIEAMGGLGLMVLIVKGVIWLGDRVW